MPDRSPAGACPSPTADGLLQAAVAAAPRPYRMPALPPTAQQAREAGPDAAVAFAMEHARLAVDAGSAPPPELESLFTEGLAALVRLALAPDGGDPSFQALVLRSGEPELRAFLDLQAASTADRRAVRALVDSFAHPGKLRDGVPGPLRTQLGELHRLAAADAWVALRSHAAQFAALPAGEDDAVRRGVDALLSSDSLDRLVRGQGLRAHASVQRYLALCERSGPRAGSDAAAANGRGSALAGATAERATMEAFRRIADLLDRSCGGGAMHLACRGLRVPRGFPDPAPNAKDEWDAALVHLGPGGTADVLLLAEVKAAPAAAAPDLPRLLRGLQRLASVRPDQAHAFPSADGEVRITGRSLVRLQPQGAAVPPRVIYCCPASATANPRARPLTPAAQGLLMAEDASLAYARALARGERPPHGGLAAVWHGLGDRRLRAALAQYDRARRSREAMLDPADLVAAVEALVQR